MGGPVQSSIQYVLELDKFSAFKIRSGDKDTDVVTFRAKVGDLLYPAQTERMENILEGDHYLKMYIGPILAPINTPVNFGFTILNSGYGGQSKEMLQVVNALSDFCDAVCQALLKSAVWDTFNTDTKYLNQFILANCDGPVAADGQWIAVDVLQEWTANGPYVRTTGPYIGTLPPQNPVTCHTDSHYTVTWSVVPKTDELGLLGMSSDGRVWYATRREPDGSWIPFSQLQPPSGSPFVAISHAGSVNDNWHIYGITSDGGIWHTNSLGEQWQDVRKVTSSQGGFDPVSVTTIFGELHVCSITPYDGNIWHIIRDTYGSWQPSFSNVKSLTSNPGTFTDVSCAGVAGELHVCGVTADGDLWHVIRHMDGSWQPSFSNVKSLTSNPGTFTDVSCAGVADELNLCGVTTDGGLWHTIRHMDGTWAPFFDVKNQAGNPSSPAEIPPAFVDCSSAGVNGDLHLCGITSDGSLWHTIRHVGGWWELFENVTGQAGGQGPFSVVSATQLLWTWFPPQPPQVTIQGSVTIAVTLADLDPANPVLAEGPYSVNPVGLQAPLKIQWRGELGAAIRDDTAYSTWIDFDMTGQILPQGHKEFMVSVSVTDRLGVSVSAQARIFIRIIDRGKGGG